MLGHFDQQRKNIQSTKLHDDDQDTMHTPSPLDKGLQTHALYAATICYNQQTGKLYTDLTGQFPVQSSRGHKYILVIYNFDSNSIHVKPLKGRHDSNTTNAYEEIYNMLKQRCQKPQLHWLDSEACKTLKKFITKEQMQYQLTPPHIHKRNAAERAICTFKNHFISGLCSVDKNFPLHLWCCLLDQAELTLNMLRTSRINPNLSAYKQLHGIHDFNATPLAPTGTKCIAHEKSSQRGTWAPHGHYGWYIVPQLNSIKVIKSTSQKHRAHEFVIQWSSFQRIAKCQTCHHMMQSYMKQTTSSQHSQSPNHPIQSYHWGMTNSWPYAS